MMNWIQAKELISKEIKEGLDLDPLNKYKEITKCSNDGLYIRVGANKVDKISFNELENIFNSAKANNGQYKNSVFKALYPVKIKNTPCLVQAVGKIFVYAGVMKQRTAQSHEIIAL